MSKTIDKSQIALAKDEKNMRIISNGKIILEMPITEYGDDFSFDCACKVLEKNGYTILGWKKVEDFVRPLLPEECKYTYRNSQQISMQTGLIGYIRADMGTNGNEFWSTWNGFRNDLNTPEFNSEMVDILNSFADEGGFLSNRNELAKFCRSDEVFAYDTGRDFGVRIDTKEYSYLMRLNPHKGEYNLYCYCYKKDWLNSHLEKAKRGIRFIDSNYKDKFRIADGDKIRITFADSDTSVRNGDTSVRECRYIDDYHLEVGNDLYHVCQFAEIMERNGNKVEPIGAEENA